MNELNTQQLIAAIAQSIDDVIYAKDLQGRLVFANPAALSLIGKPEQEVLGRTDAQFLDDPQAAQAVMENDRRVLDQGEAIEVEEIVPRPDGTQAIWASRKAPYRDETGRIVGLLGISRDITQRVQDATSRRQSEDALKKAQQLLQSTMDHFPTVIAFKDLEGRFIEVNRALETLLHKPRNEILGLTAFDLLDGDAARHITDSEQRVMAQRTAAQIERRRSIRGKEWTFLDTVFPLLTEAGALYGVGYISHDVTAVDEAQKALRAANEELRETSRQKDLFLATLAHELRNPLAPLRNVAAILMHRKDDPAVLRLAAVIERQVAHMARLVDDLLDLSRITHGQVQLRPEPLDVVQLARDVAAEHQDAARAAGVRLLLDLPPQPLALRADPTRLSQCLSNLVHNSLKFTPSGGSVQVRVQADPPGQVLLEVRDEGMGIEPRNLERVFDLFVQEHTSGMGINSGLGIGLSVTRQLIQLHGGTITAASAGRGQGATFTIRLPVQGAEAQGSGASAPILQA